MYQTDQGPVLKADEVEALLSSMHKIETPIFIEVHVRQKVEPRKVSKETVVKALRAAGMHKEAEHFEMWGLE